MQEWNMTQVGKLFKKMPYIVRDAENSYKDIKYVEAVFKELVSEYNIKEENIINIFSNNRDNLLHFHLVTKVTMPKESLCVNYKGDALEFTFEEYKESKSKTKYINSFMFIETFKHLGEDVLVSVFDDMIGCNGKELFISTNKENLKLFQPSSKHYRCRKVLLEKREAVEDTCTTFNIDCTKLYEELNPNLIKQVCKDLALTYKNLSYELGYKPDTINKAASTGKVSDQLRKAIDLYLENLRLSAELKDLEMIKKTLRNAMV
ncbi:hypothetical protein [Poseidonibacter lekithochrous]|uniref:hypothetical protein n=2 Tax=Poseidonibacter lekithochrous TaxID=1904463 RepID=UPI001D175A86|nr:hypothetical protein [Poseidonibacter lekithochrous]